ncbi:SDR family oxidoreductase [Streptomyces coeruleorubidus]|uniref:SDR family oxidoreductase n=1 Tax=Streptomyces coeruleorubidus TaxID=116188 RepID=UPI00387E62D2
MGLATARAFAESGAAVALTDIDEAALNTAAKNLTDVGHRVLVVTCDVSDEDKVAAAVDRTVETFGRLDMANRRRKQCGPSNSATFQGNVLFEQACFRAGGRHRAVGVRWAGGAVWGSVRQRGDTLDCRAPAGVPTVPLVIDGRIAPAIRHGGLRSCGVRMPPYDRRGG